VELIVVGFRGRYRAAQVLNDLRQRGLHLFDLDQAITISWEDRRNFIVQQSVNLSREEGSLWASLWGPFIKATLFQPFTETLTRAANRVASRSTRDIAESCPEVLGRDWWVIDVGIPADFIRDVGALVQPGESAIITLAEHFDAKTSINLLRDLGGAVVYTSLDRDQMEKVESALAAAG
jgi:uncharacterized membrane protein